MRHGLSTFIALPLVMGFLGCSSMSTTQKGAAIGGLGGAAAGGLVGSAVPIRSQGRLSVVRLEQGVVLLLETSSRATKRCSNSSKKKLIGKVLR